MSAKVYNFLGDPNLVLGIMSFLHVPFSCFQ